MVASVYAINKAYLLTYLCLQISENDETFVVSLITALGGSSVEPSINSPRVNTSYSQAVITVAANDAPVRFSQVRQSITQSTRQL